MKNRNGAIDFMKFVFSFVIVFFHGRLLANTPDEMIFVGGYIGVEFFFLVAGYMLMSTYERNEHTLSVCEDTFRFMKKKFFGLMPNVLLAGIIVFIVENLGRHSGSWIYDFGTGPMWRLLLLQQFGLGDPAFDPTWYLSAMLISMFFIYPLIRRFYKSFYYIATIVFLFGTGFLYQYFGWLGVGNEWFGFMYAGLIRATSEILAGCICYKISNHLKEYRFAKGARLALTLIEWALYLGVIAYIFKHGPSAFDFVLFFMLIIAVIITTSNIGYGGAIFNKKFFFWLGEYSFSLYLCNFFWRDYFRALDGSYAYKLLIYTLVSFTMALAVMYASKGLRYWWNKNKRSIRKLVIED